MNNFQWQELHMRGMEECSHPVQVHVDLPGLRLPRWDMWKVEQVAGRAGQGLVPKPLYPTAYCSKHSWHCHLHTKIWDPYSAR